MKKLFTIVAFSCAFITSAPVSAGLRECFFAVSPLTNEIMWDATLASANGFLYNTIKNNPRTTCALAACFGIGLVVRYVKDKIDFGTDMDLSL